MARVVVVRKKVRYEDPNAPTYVRIPPQPITRSWCKTIAPFSKPTDDPIGSTYAIAFAGLIPTINSHDTIGLTHFTAGYGLAVVSQVC